MSTIQHDNNATAGRRHGLAVFLHGCRDICLAVGEALADVLSLHRSPTSPRLIAPASPRVIASPDPSPAPPVLPQSAARSDDGELIWELRRVLAHSGRKIADVVRTLETQAVEVDARARDLIQDELHALDVDLAALKALLSDPVDWDSEYERLLAGEVAPFDDDPSDDDDETD